MTPERWAQVKALFAARSRCRAQRARRAAHARSRDDAALIAEVQSLLESHDAPAPSSIP